MSKLRMLLLLSAAVIVGACSDTQSPTSPATEPETDPSLSQERVTNELKGEWGPLKDVSAQASSPLLCNAGGNGPECLRVFYSGQVLQRVFHVGRAQGTGCSRSVIKIDGVVRGRSGFTCHRRGDVLSFTWFVGGRWLTGTRIQVDYTGGGSSSPTGFVFTFFRRF
jgi:hypothetical protein